MADLIRLNKFISESGICSRRKADEHILAGKVFVNEKRGETGQKIDPDNDKVVLYGKTVNPPEAGLVYYALYKPRGVISTASDESGRKSVIDLVPKEPRVYPVGRLDKDSEGLMILTNDGELTQKITHPSSEHEKEYFVCATAQKGQDVSFDNFAKRFLNGISIDGQIMKADKVESSQTTQNRKQFYFNITIHTGFNRQIRRMCDKIGLEVTKLKRIRIGKLTLDSLNLSSGDYEKINKIDII